VLLEIAVFLVGKSTGQQGKAEETKKKTDLLSIHP
jgi:hypothetical protein